MNKEELEQKAYEYAITEIPFIECITQNDLERLVQQAYLAGAEPREKRIAELEAQIERMKNWCNCKNYQQCLIELAEQGKGMNPSECCVNCKKWEIKEK
ncbi:MAG: hypothetical protein J6S85_11490 [Methanobrevibacter sp.]|nr:hypothetical protein [Methanobrevibacter sp.]